MQNRDRSSQPLLSLVTARSFALSLVAALLVASMIGAVAAAGTTAGAKRDRRPPTVPTGLNVTSKTTSAVTLAWSASTDNVGVAGYGVYRNGTRIATATSTGYTVANLPCGLFTIGVDAYDAARNRSKQTSVSVNVCGDVQPPSAPATPVVSGSSNASLSLSWSPSVDNVGVAGYDVFAADAQVGSTGADELHRAQPRLRQRVHRRGRGVRRRRQPFGPLHRRRCRRHRVPAGRRGSPSGTCSGRGMILRLPGRSVST